MKKKVFVISWFYNIGAFIGIGVILGCIVFICIMTANQIPIAGTIAIIVGGSAFSVVYFIIFGKTLVQWVAIDEKGITARSLLSVIRRITWEDVKEVQLIRTSYIPTDPQMSWLMFVEKAGGEPYYRTAFNVKGKYVKIKANKKNREILKQLRPDIEFTEFWGY